MAELIQLTTSDSCLRWVKETQAAGMTVGLVPTMGALHEGHLSLVEHAQQHCDKVLVTIFVNPTQFGPNEDYNRYPRDLKSDIEKLQSIKTDVVFSPSVEEVYPSGDGTLVDVGPVAEPWEGKLRPGHYRGVATVVLKLMNLVPAELAFFGQKDYQQTLVIKQMVRDLHVPTKVVVCPTVRESDGLAKSSRNAYLSDVERQRALSLSKALQLVQSRYDDGIRDARLLESEATELIKATGGVVLQYFALLAPGTIEAVDIAESGVVAVVAAKVGKTRLIDNLILH